MQLLSIQPTLPDKKNISFTWLYNSDLGRFGLMMLILRYNYLQINYSKYSSE